MHLDLTVKLRTELNKESSNEPLGVDSLCILTFAVASVQLHPELQKGVVPAAPSGTATLLRLSPNHEKHDSQPKFTLQFKYHHAIQQFHLSYLF